MYIGHNCAMLMLLRGKESLLQLCLTPLTLLMAKVQSQPDLSFSTHSLHFLSCVGIDSEHITGVH